jgi:hypothetical protein
MRLEIALNKAIKYACLNFHYSKTVPAICNGYSIFNEKNEWCGVILFNRGAISSAKQYGFKNGQVAELIRMALNGKQSKTSKILSIAIKLFSKHNPNVKLLVSFADEEMNHKGTIYQATNWIFTGSYKTGDIYKDINGKKVHPRRITKSGFVKGFNGKIDKCLKLENVIKIKGVDKHKYIYPLNKNLIPLCKSLSKPYPKQAVEVHKLNSSNTFEKVGGANPTQPLK